MSTNSLELLAQARARSREMSAGEKRRVTKGEKPWGVYESSLSDYLETFESVLPEGGLEAYLANLVKTKKRRLRALDIAGQGTPLMELRGYLSSIVAVTLIDHRSETQKQNDLCSDLMIVAGDISNGSTWSEIGEVKFDLITCRPLGAIDALTASEIIFAVFNRMYQRLGDDGLLLTEVPYCVIHEHGVAWAEALRRSGVSMRICKEKYTRKNTLSVIRTKGSPKDLRFLKRMV